jgi:hypothetical protein
VTERAELAESVELIVAEDGLRLPKTPSDFTCKVKAPLKPLMLLSEMVEVVAEPMLRSTWDGWAERAKSGPVTGPSTVMVMGIACDIQPNPT